MKKALAFGLILCALPFAASAVEISSYGVAIDTRPDGAANVHVEIDLDECAAGTIELPIGFASPRDIRFVQTPPGSTISTTARNGQTIAWMTLPEGVSPAAKVEITFSVASVFLDVEPTPREKRRIPEGGQILRHSLLNTSPVTIDRYRVTATFPDDLRAHAIRDRQPPLRKTESEPRVLLTTTNGKDEARLQATQLAQGMTATMEIELVPKKRSLGWLVFGAALSLLYLIRFRDLVARRAD